MWLKESPGNRASKKRSTRIPASSDVTVTVWTLSDFSLSPLAGRGSG
jgi:hypothetical protein